MRCQCLNCCGEFNLAEQVGDPVLSSQVRIIDLFPGDTGEHLDSVVGVWEGLAITQELLVESADYFHVW